MALILADRVRELTATTGTGSVTLIGSPDGFETFAASIGDGNTTYYTIAEKTGDNWEVGVGTYRSAGNLLERTTVLSSSNGGNKVAFAAGDKDVFVILPAEKVVSTDAAGTMAYQNADAVAITGGTIDGTTIGSTTPDAATFTTLIGGKDQANYGQLTGGATTKAVEFRTLGSDTNIACAIRSKGTGAIDLAAGSSGVNISNGGTVTAITRTGTGFGYTSFPSVAISAPTTAGGVQATASVATMVNTGSAVQSGGTGYTVGDTLTVVGGTFTAAAATLTVTSVSGSVITAATPANFGQYTVLPTNPVSVTGGTGTGATFNLTFGIGSAPSFTITNAGSGYVEQPTVTFSGGGGSGAAAYATVGSGTTVTGLGTTISFKTPGGEQFRVIDSGASAVNYVQARGGGSGSGASVEAAGVESNINLNITSLGTGSVRLFTNNKAQEQLRVSHTASAVNYVQVTGATTGGSSLVLAQGSDTNVSLALASKAGGYLSFRTNTSTEQFRVYNTTSAVNRVEITGSIANAAPIVAVAGTDTNIDLTLTPKGTGLVRFGTYTAGAPTATGYISIKAANGTTYKVLVGT